MAKGLTDKQHSILEFLIDFQKENGFPPTIRELGDAFSIRSLRGVTVHLDALVRKGYITRSRTSRSIRVVSGSDQNSALEAFPRLPLVSDTNALGEGGSEGATVAVPDEIAAAATPAGYVVRIPPSGVPGEAAILPGDLIVVRPQKTAIVGELAAVRQEGRIGVRRAAGSDTGIAGRVVGLIRCY